MKCKDIDGQILSLDCAKREQIQKFQLAEGDGDKVHEPKGLLTFQVPRVTNINFLLTTSADHQE